MSSYRQEDQRTTVGKAIEEATETLAALWDEMAELCADIAAQFPNTYGDILKYQQALTADNALGEAISLLDDLSLSWSFKQTAITITVGRQTRRKRPQSQRVRLGNAIVRLTAVARAAKTVDEDDATLWEIIEPIAGISFPQAWG